MQDLLDILGENVSMENYCGHPGCYLLWEEKIAQPTLEQLGYTVLRWRTGERDSFGPLSRIVTVEKAGVVKRFIYG